MVKKISSNQPAASQWKPILKIATGILITAIAVQVIRSIFVSNTTATPSIGSFAKKCTVAPLTASNETYAIHPGLVANRQGENYCETPMDFSDCTKMVDHIVRKLAIQGIQLQMPEGEDPEGKGAYFPVLGLSRKIYFHADPNKLVAHSKALQYVRNKTLPSAHPFSQSAESFLKSIQTLHHLLVTGNTGTPKIGYRTQELSITDDNAPAHTKEGLAEWFKSQGATPQMVKHFQTGFDQLRSRFASHKEDIDKSLSFLTKEEQEAVQQVITFPLNSRKIPKAMKEFAKQLLEVSSHHTNFIDLAAWAHQRIVHIHPFENGNGRLARTLMNRILELGGYHPIAFLNEQEYTKAAKNLQDHRPLFELIQCGLHQNSG